MDTIEIGLKIKEHINLTIQELETMKGEIEGLMSPFGYNYCNYLSFSSAKKIIIKISYPRFFAGTNAYLITKRSECFQVQNHFVNNFLFDILWSNYIEGISLNRVDIPFTYLMETTEEFASYENIYYIFAHVYDRKIENARTKAYLDLINKGYETLIYAPNGSVGKSYNNEIVRRAFGISIDNENTRENAITRVRQVLIQYENTHNIILMDVYGTLKKIEAQIKTTYLLD